MTFDLVNEYGETSTFSTTVVIERKTASETFNPTSYIPPETAEKMVAMRNEQKAVVPSRDIRITWVEFNEIGHAVFDFSEELTPLEELSQPLTVKEISNDNFIMVNYTSNLGPEVADEKRPTVLQWQVSSFGRNKMEMTFNFSNPLYISSGAAADTLQITILENLIFRGGQNRTIEKGFTASKEIPL